MGSSATLLGGAFTLLLPLLLVNPSQATSFRDVVGGALPGTRPPPSNEHGFHRAEPTRAWIPALFVFGDSLVDSGNNNFLHTISKADFRPYGSTFFHKPTGRFTDGRTVVDFIAQLNGLPYPPPYLSLNTECSPMPKTGLNFASGSCGILPDTGKPLGNCLNFDRQIRLFKEARNKGLKNQFRNQSEFSRYLSKSMFYIAIGNNDYMLGYLIGEPKVTPETFAEFLVQQLTLRLKQLYEMGARKFVVNNIGAIGTTPAVLNLCKSQQCGIVHNGAVSKFNDLLPGVLTNLQAELPGSKFVVSNIFKLVLDIKASPAAYQISDTTNTCCVDRRNGTEPCLRDLPPCKDVKSHLFFDMAHPTQHVHYLLMRRCFTDLTICSPLTLSQLLRA